MLCKTNNFFLLSGFSCLKSKIHKAFNATFSILSEIKQSQQKKLRKYKGRKQTTFLLKMKLNIQQQKASTFACAFFSSQLRFLFI